MKILHRLSLKFLLSITSTGLLEARPISRLIHSGSSLISVSPISLCFLLRLLSSADPAEFIVSSSFIPPCNFSRVASFIMLFSWILFLSFNILPRFERCWRALGILVLLSISASVLTMLCLFFTFYADCVSINRSHIHCHVELILGILVHTFNGDRAKLNNGGLQEEVLKLVIVVRTISGASCQSHHW